MARRSNGGQQGGKIRYAVVGLGYFAQMSILPAFAHARKNSELAALISGDKTKLNKLGAKYGVEYRGSYDEFEDCLKKANVDAIYLATPNSLHHEYTVRAACAGVHVLCEKPMAVTEKECSEFDARWAAARFMISASIVSMRLATSLRANRSRLAR
jgi:predicted dehydrogenase